MTNPEKRVCFCFIIHNSKTPETLRPDLEKYLLHHLPIVIYKNEIPGWTPSSTASVSGADKKTYKINLYVIAKPGDGVSFSKFGRTP